MNDAQDAPVSAKPTDRRERTDALPVHGGDLDAIAAAYGIARERLLDFSANLNPVGPPKALLDELAIAAADRASLGRYPEPDAGTLRAAIARHERIDPGAIVVANGAAALIECALATFGITRCALPVPAFSEDARAMRALGIERVASALDPARDFAFDPDAFLERARAGDADGCLITNPHNPSGAVTSAAMLRETIERARAFGMSTIVDEAFIDYALHETLTRDAATTEGLIVIRSLTKFYAVPALRVGYVVCAPSLAARMRARLPSWPVTTIAARALAAALTDDRDFAERSLHHNLEQRENLRSELARLGHRAFPSAANFVLVALRANAPHARDLVATMIREFGIVLRDCTSYEGLNDGRYARVAVRSADENRRLIDALANALRPRAI